MSGRESRFEAWLAYSTRGFLVLLNSVRFSPFLPHSFPSANCFCQERKPGASVESLASSARPLLATSAFRGVTCATMSTTVPTAVMRRDAVNCVLLSYASLSLSVVALRRHATQFCSALEAQRASSLYRLSPLADARLRLLLHLAKLLLVLGCCCLQKRPLNTLNTLALSSLHTASLSSSIFDYCLPACLAAHSVQCPI